MASADLLVLRADGTTRTSNWNFHDRQTLAQDGHDDGSDSHPAYGIRAAMDATLERHASNRALVAAGLSSKEWRRLFNALIEAESGFNPGAISPKGAIGLGQLMPATARSLGVDPHDISQNLDGAARYLLTQLARFGDVDLALAAYNAGPQSVVAHGGVPPFPETRAYIARIAAIRGRLATGRGDPPSRIATRPTRANAPVVLDLTGRGRLK